MIITILLTFIFGLIGSIAGLLGAIIFGGLGCFVGVLVSGPGPAKPTAADIQLREDSARLAKEFGVKISS